MQIKRNCPNCGVEMRHVTTKSHYDAPILLDQCEVCGGIWVDAHELYKVSYKEIDQLKELDNDIHNDIKKDFPIKKNLKCPTDGALLVQPSKSLFPTDLEIVVEMCPTCRSVWFNHGEFINHQLHRAEANRRNKETPTEKETEAMKTVRELLEKERLKTPNYKKIANFLTTPVKGGSPGNIHGLLPALLSTLRDAVNEQTFSDSDKFSESIIPASQKEDLLSMTPKNFYNFSALHELNARYRRDKKKSKVKLIIIIFLLSILIISLTTIYFNNKKDEKMRSFRFCFQQLECPNYIRATILEEDKIKRKEAINCYAICEKEYNTSYGEFLQWEMEGNHLFY